MSSPQANSVYSSTSGTTSTNVFIAVIADIDPSPSDINYPIQKRWINKTSYREFMLVEFTSFNGQLQANWIPLGNSSGSPGLVSLKGNTGASVLGDTNQQIAIVGDGSTCTIAGNPSAHSLTVTAINPAVQKISFRATATSNQALVTGDGTPYTVLFPNAVYDSATNYNTSTGVFTAPVTGTYIFVCGIGYSLESESPGDATFVQAGFTVNGSTNDIGFASPTSVTCTNYYGFPFTTIPLYYFTFSSIYRLNANDQVACLIIGQGGSVKDVSIDPLNTANCYFAGALI